MVSKEKRLFETRRMYVNERYGDLTRGKRLTKKQQDRLLRRLWKDAKRRYK